MKKTFFILTLVLGLIALSATSTQASEGETNLGSVIGDGSSCNAKSALMTDNKYTILITCKDLIYPPTTDTNAYIVWATPSDGGNPIRLGALGFGRAQFRTAEAFSNMFVSRERVNSQNLNSIRTPGVVVMRGNVEIDPAAPPIFEAPVDESEILATPAPKVTSSLFGRIGTGVVVTIISVIAIVVMLVIVKPFK